MSEQPLPDPPLAKLPGIGPRVAEWLEGVGIESRDQLERVGAVESFRRLQEDRPRVSRNLLYALQGAILGLRGALLPPALRNRLDDELKNDL